MDSSPSDQESLQRDSKEIESCPHQIKPSEMDIKNFIQEMRERSNPPVISDVSGLSSNPQERKLHLGVVGERMLWTWYQPVRECEWPVRLVFEKLKNLRLIPKQQERLEKDLDLDHWALYKKIRQDSFDALRQKLIYSIRANRQVATILLANGDAILNHRLSIKQATATTAHGAFTPVRVRDMFQLGPKTIVLPGLDPKHKGLLSHISV